MIPDPRQIPRTLDLYPQPKIPKARAMCGELLGEHLLNLALDRENRANLHCALTDMGFARAECSFFKTDDSRATVGDGLLRLQFLYPDENHAVLRDKAGWIWLIDRSSPYNNLRVVRV